VNTGKTKLTKRLLEEALEDGHGDITVIDMAPRSIEIDGMSIGGSLLDDEEVEFRYLRKRFIKTPRLSAKSSEELIELADHNRFLLETLLEEFFTNPTSILFVNDVSMYLQRGDLKRLWRTFERADTVIANGYLGERLKEDRGTGISDRERVLMEELASRMKIIIRLGNTSSSKLVQV
jgi:hypothetical protein